MLPMEQNMTNLWKLLGLSLILVASSLFFSACGNDDDGQKGKSEPVEEDDSDSDNACPNKNPQIIDISANMHNALWQNARDANGNVLCDKYAENMGTYFDNNSESLQKFKDAVVEFKDYVDNINSLQNALCAGIDSIKIYNAAKVIEEDYSAADQCAKALREGQTPESQAAYEKLNNGINNMKSVEGWNSILSASANAAIEN